MVEDMVAVTVMVTVWEKTTPTVGDSGVAMRRRVLGSKFGGERRQRHGTSA
jgi:hypothetical protein